MLYKTEIIVIYCIQVTDHLLLSDPTSKWSIEHAANAGVFWDPQLNFKESIHPALFYGELHSQDSM
jgi:hypothetical protein